MSSVTNHHARPLDRILVIDELPLISVAFQELFRSVNPSASVTYCENIFRALSAKTYAGAAFDLIVVGSVADGRPEKAVAELKDRFSQPSVMLYSGVYDPAMIEKMEEDGVDAYVHRYESIEEIREAYRRLSAGTHFISGIFRTLYDDYRFGPGK